MEDTRPEALERRILDILKKAGEKGILQRDLWGILNVDSRRGIKVIRRLERMGLIKREACTYKGRKTYILRPTPKAYHKVELPPFLDEIPCFYCPRLQRCSRGDLPVETCEVLEERLLEASRKVLARVKA